MNKVQIRELPEIINREGCTYKRLAKNDKWSIYQQFNEDNRLIAYEVMHRRFSKPHSKDKTSLDKIEYFSSNEDFGTTSESDGEGSYPTLQTLANIFGKCVTPSPSLSNCVTEVLTKLGLDHD